MSTRWTPTDEHRVEAIRRLLSGLAAGKDVFELSEALEELHPRGNTFPGEVFMQLVASALDLAGVSSSEPLPYEGLMDRFVPEVRFRGRDHSKFKFALLDSVAERGGIAPDLLDEVIWWRTDDFWRYALTGAAAVIRAAADRTGECRSWRNVELLPIHHPVG